MAKGNKALAFIGVLLAPISSIIILLASKDAYAKYYSKQGLLLGIAGLVFMLFPILEILVFIFGIIALVNSLSGKMKPLPVVGQLIGQK